MANISATGKAGVGARQAPSGDSPGLDLATLLGVLGAFAIIAVAMVIGGSPRSFLDLPAILIVFGGTLLVTTSSFSLTEMFGARSVAWRAVVYNAEHPSTAARRVLYLADQARHRGALSLADKGRAAGQSPFLTQAVQLVADGMPVEEIKNILILERDATQQRHTRAAGILRRAGEVAPAMGLIGTLVGLIQMLGNLDDPSTIGPSMAVALLTTFYGAILANMLFNPLASKLERNSHIEATVNEIYAMGAVCISRQENPRRLEMRINSILSPAERVNFFD